jgi:rare lipoprotein A
VNGRFFVRHVCICLFFAILAGCAKPPTPPPPPGPSMPAPEIRTQRPYQIKGIWYYPLPTAQGYVEEGLASWYGTDFHGKPTSCGEPYDMYALTAAHKTLPLGTHVKVSNPENGRSIILRVNDRGPFVAGRIIDLSCKAAEELGTMQKGVSRVRVEAVQVASEQHIGRNTFWKVDPMPSLRYGAFNIQIGSFREQNNALRLREKMLGTYSGTQVFPVPDREGTFYRVHVGTFKDILLAQRELDQLRRNGFGDAFVVAVEGK